MQTLTKLTKNDIIKSLVSFIAGTAGLYVLIVLMILLNAGASGFSEYFVKNQQALLTVAVSIAVLDRKSTRLNSSH